MVTETNIVSEERSSTEQIKHALGQVVMKAREDAGFKQRPFARITGISNSHLRSIEAGEVSPTLVTLCKIAATLDVEPSQLVAAACELVSEGDLDSSF